MNSALGMGKLSLVISKTKLMPLCHFIFNANKRICVNYRNRKTRYLSLIKTKWFLM